MNTLTSCCNYDDSAKQITPKTGKHMINNLTKMRLKHVAFSF